MARLSYRWGKVATRGLERLASRHSMASVTGGKIENRVLNDYAKEAPKGASSFGVSAFAPEAAGKDAPKVATGLQKARGGLTQTMGRKKPR